MSKLLGRLKHKYGPLPLWAWAAIAGGAFALYWRLRRPPAAPADAIAEPAIAYGGEPDYGDTGAGAVGPVGPDLSEVAPGTDLAELSARVGDLAGHVTELEDAATSSGWWVDENKEWHTPGGEEGGGSGGETRVEPETGASSSRFGVFFGGRRFETRATLARFIASTGGGTRDARKAWKLWAKRHPSAAAKLAGAPPKPAPPRRPKPKPKPSTRAGARKPPAVGRGGGGARARTPTPKAKAKKAPPRAKVVARKPPPRPQPKAGRKRR